MKKYIGVLSLVVFLLTQVFTPFTYVYAVSEDDCKPRESRNEGSNQCDPQCTHQQYVEYGECKLQCKPHQEVVKGYEGYECDDKCSPDATWDGNVCTCLAEGEVRDNDKEACIPCDYLHERDGSTCVEKDLSKISFDIRGGSGKDPIYIPKGTNLRNLIEKKIKEDREDMIFYPYSKYFTIPYANKLNMMIDWTYYEDIGNRSGVNSLFFQPYFKLKTKDEEKNFTLKTDDVVPEAVYHPPYNTGWNGNSGTFFGYGYGFSAIITGDTLEVEPNPLLTFDGWYTKEDYTDELNIDNAIDTNITLYGRYAAKISFDTMGGDPIQDILINSGELFHPIDAVRPYSSFLGWYTNKNFSDGFNENEPIKQNMTLYANFSCDNEDLTYTGNVTGHNLGVYQCFGFNSLNIGAYTLMDRNLGAYSTGNWNSNNNSTGYYYQWGNNYGFSNVINSKGAIIRLKDDNPYTSSIFGYGYETKSEYNKSEYYYKSLRGNRSNNNQSRQGPCPEGWHVPTRGEWLGVIDAWIEKEDLSRGVDYYHNNKKEYTGFSDNSLADYLLFPTTNHVELSGDNAIYSGNGGIGGAWTAGYGYGFYFGKDENDKYYASVKEYVAALDFIPVRCFQNKTYLTFKDKRDTSKVYGVTGFVENEQNSIGNVSNFPAGIKYPEDASYYTGKILPDGTIEFSETSLNIESLLAQEFSEDTTIYVDYPRYTVRLHSLDNSDVEEYDVLYMKGNITTSEFNLPSLEKETSGGETYNFMGWFTGADYRDLGLSYSGSIRSNLTGEGGVVDLYPHFSKDITIKLKPNGNTIKSGDNETISDIVINSTIYDNDEYTLTFPQIVNGYTPDIIGFTLGEKVYDNPHNSGDTLSLVDSKTFFAQTKKDISFIVVPNNNKIKVGNVRYEGPEPDQQYKTGITLYNGVNTWDFKFPDAIENTETPDVLGFSTGSEYYPDEYYQTGILITLSGSETYYAQTKKDYEEKQAIFLKGQGVTLISGSTAETLYDSCTPVTTYNSDVNDTCKIKTPSITVATGQKPGKWNNKYTGGEGTLTLSQATSYFIAGTESNIYSVYYDYNGGSAGASHPSTYNGGETLTISDPSRPGYTFIGWIDQNGDPVVSTTTIENATTIESANGNYHFTADWELTQYTITFAGVDETVKYQDNPTESYPTSLPCTYEDVFTLDTPVKAGYEFQGWQLEDGTTKKVVTISKTTSDRVLTGVWGSGTYNIVYNLNGGTNDANNPESYTYSTTEDVILHSGTRVGYSFSGWYDNPNFEGTPVTKIVKGSHNHVVLHAKRIQNIYTITFNDVNGATLENTNTPYPLSMTGAYDDVITLSTPSKEGYEFDGWEIGNSSVITKTVTLSKLTEDKTITAHWTAKRYSITYYPNGGTNNVNNPESYTYSDTSSVTLYSGTRVGYRFDGWYTLLNGGDEVISIPAEAHKNYVLYAHWTANTNTSYKVYHYQESLDGGHLLKDTDSLQGTSDVQVTPAVKTTYEGFKAPSPQTVTIRPDGETRVEYYYTRNIYSIMVDYNGGKDSNNQSSVTYTKKYGDTIEEVIPTRDGYSFSGWSGAYPKTMPVVEGTEPKTITALWTANAYTITYNNVEYADNYNTRYGYNTSDESFELSGAVWTGYQFSGWWTQAVGGTQVTAITANDHENKVLYAHWTPRNDIKYTVIHRRQGLDQYYNDNDLKEEVVYTNGVTATTIEAEQKNYPGFIPPEVKEITIKGDGTSVVEYRYQRMRFTYASEGNVGVDTKGTTANNQYMFYGAPLTLSATVDTGYSWSGWYIKTGDDDTYRLFTTDQNRTGQNTIGLPAYNSVVKPVVTHDVYTLSFDAAGGIATGTISLDAQNHYYNDEITLPEVVRTGYIFQGWYTESNGQGIKYEADTKMPVGNVTLHAYWIEGEVNVKVEYYLMNLDGVTYPEQPSDKLELQRTTNSIYTGEVKTFKGFTLSGDEQSVQVAAEGTSVIKYYYKRNSYSLDLIGLTGFNYVSVVSTNHPDGVEIISGVVQSANYYYGEPITITGELLTGYGMDKWNGTKDIGKNSGTPVFTFTMPDKTVELTPNVTKNTYKATYKDGDRVIVVYDVVYEDVVPTPTAPSKYGYKFTGWRYYPVSGTMPANNIEIQAMWESVPVNNGGGGGGGGSSSSETKKVIINTTGDKQQEHNSAELTGTDKKIEDTKKVEDEKETVKSDEVENITTDETTTEKTNTPTNTSSNQSMNVDQEVLTAYEWAYKHDVTTLPTLDDAMPDGVVKRGHLAKMVVNYATNVLGQQLPEKVPSECRWSDNKNEWESEEIKDYAVKACSLGLMGLDMKKFQPNMNVTRAQFGTIMSRLLWGKKYAGGTPYYKKHLNALKENNIMTQIQNPEKRTELRQWVWLMLMRSADNK